MGTEHSTANKVERGRKTSSEPPDKKSIPTVWNLLETRERKRGFEFSSDQWIRGTTFEGKEGFIQRLGNRNSRDKRLPPSWPVWEVDFFPLGRFHERVDDTSLGFFSSITEPMMRGQSRHAIEVTLHWAKKSRRQQPGNKKVELGRVSSLRICQQLASRNYANCKSPSIAVVKV